MPPITPSASSTGVPEPLPGFAFTMSILICASLRAGGEGDDRG